MKTLSALLALWGEFTGHRWIPLTKASDSKLWYFLWSALEQTFEQTIETPVIRAAIGLIMTSLSRSQVSATHLKIGHPRMNSTPDARSYYNDVTISTRQFDCFFHRLFRPTSKKTFKPILLVLCCEGNPPVTGGPPLPSAGSVSLWWRHQMSCNDLAHQGLYSPSGETPYRQISWSLEAARLDVAMVVSLWNLTGTSAAALPRYLPNFRAIGKV